LPILFGQLLNPFLFIGSGVHARNLLDHSKITKITLSENRQLLGIVSFRISRG
jgi:hypothetical protein